LPELTNRKENNKAMLTNAVTHSQGGDMLIGSTQMLTAI
jgi:hypothetical protein